ncbi:MAG: phosphodiester glycosidase family protein [Armatimonadota bacterium]
MAYSRRAIAGADLHVIDVDLNDARVVVSPAIALRGIGRAEQFASFIGRLQPAAAINGTFFSKRSLRPVADIVINGKLVHFGGIGTAFAVAADGVDFIRLPKSRRVDWSEHKSALAGGPLLVWEGFAKPLPGGEGFGDPHVFARAAPRTAIGITRANHLLLVTTAKGCSLAKLARAMKAMGAIYAFNLDGGASAGMWHRGRMIARPKRPLTNVLCVYVKPTPASTTKLRPPRGLDWRSGHTARPGIGFRAGEMRVWVKLPRRWEGSQSLLITADRPLPAGWTLSAKLDGEPVGEASSLPAEIPLDLSGCHTPKHHLWVGLLDDQGKTIGRVDRFFKPGTPGRDSW